MDVTMTTHITTSDFNYIE